MSGVEITGTVLGAGAVVARFAEGSTRAQAIVQRSVQALGLELLARVKSQKLTGQVLKVQTGRLRRSINEKTTAAGSTVESVVGTNVSYGRFWELGFHGDVAVRAHTRRGKKADAMVKAHTRRVNAAPRPFLAPALEEMRARVLERLTQAAAEAASGAQP
jgi:phage gpG-like protein